MRSINILNDFVRRNVLASSIFILLVSVSLLYLAADASSLIYFVISLIMVIIVSILQKKIFLKIITLLFYLFFVLAFSNFTNPSNIGTKEIDICGNISNIDNNKIKLFNVKINEMRSTRLVYLRTADIENKFSRYEYICTKTRNNITKYQRYDYIISINKESQYSIGNRLIADIIEDISVSVNETLDYYFNEDSGLVKALVFGIKNDLESEDKKMFRDVGVGHLLVASGANILIIMLVIKSVFSSFRRKWNSLLMVFFELAAGAVYLLVVGLEGSLTRAFIFWLYLYIEQILARQVSFPIKMMYCIVLILLIFPENIFSISFYLSIAAVIGIRLSDDISRMLGIQSEFLRTFVVNISIVTCVSVVTSYYFAQINLVGIISNILVVHLVEILVAVAFVVSLLCILFGKAEFLFVEELLMSLVNLVQYGVKGLKGIVAFVESLPFTSSMNIYFYLDATGVMISILTLAFAWLLIKFKLLSMLRNGSEI